jgi:NAD(P)H-dependent FMN reductase
MADKSAIEWLEDDFYGRYEITLTVDVGTTDQMLAASKAMREFASTLDVLGYETQAVCVVGSSSHRRHR